MKLLVAVNHAAPFHVGGSEKVVQQIVNSMQNDYNIQCHILTKFTHQTKTEYDGYIIERSSPIPQEFVNQIINSQSDCLFTYSDCFCHWPTLVREAEKIPIKQSIALVGMNKMMGDSNLKSMFFNKKDLFKVITHSDDYQDYQYCQDKKIPVNVIPNGINLSEFQDQGFSFRKKYKIETPKMILCVSNFFPGKGQDHLLYMLSNMSKNKDDFTIVFICTKVSFFVANNLMQRFEILLKRNSKLRYVFLVDIPRSETIQAFIESDLFAFPSQQEVAPLVILEAMATRTPWVALNVGNLTSLSGGFVVKSCNKLNGQYVYDENVYEQFSLAMEKILNDDSLAKKMGDDGFSCIEKRFNWENIKLMYYKVFSS